MSEEYFHVSRDDLKIGSILEAKYGQIIQDSRYFMFNDLNYSQYLKEMIIEEERVQSFPKIPSRLKCIYVVDSIELAKKYLKEFNKEFIYRVKITDGIIHKVDMKWMDYNRQSLENIREIARRYFSGQTIGQDTFIECLVEGTVVIENKIYI
ncbi:DUF2441 domain-containing protein [Niallia sp. FSL W8-0954]|uniref:DUF2441 domain-containing protein n=1 Tax=Niallia sp. FSL W8-0954 TaxID=2975338 RepID=UPI0030F58969